MNKNEYLEGEPIFLTAVFRNAGNNIDSIAYYDSDEIYNNLSVWNAENVPPFMTTFIAEFGNMPYTVLKPGIEITRIIELQQYMGYEKLRKVLYSPAYVFMESDYSILYKGQISKQVSNTIKFKVKKPEGIEKAALEKLLDIHQMIIFTNGSFDTSLYTKKINEYKELINDYPNSAYIEEAFYRYNKIFTAKGMDSTMIHDNLWFIDKYPDSYYSENIVYYLVHAVYNFRSGRKSVLEIKDYINTKYPGSKASESVNLWIQNIEFEK